jgi:hypothetical protein
MNYFVYNPYKIFCVTPILITLPFKKQQSLNHTQLRMWLSTLMQNRNLIAWLYTYSLKQSQLTLPISSEKWRQPVKNLVIKKQEDKRHTMGFTADTGQVVNLRTT